MQRALFTAFLALFCATKLARAQCSTSIVSHTPSQEVCPGTPVTLSVNAPNAIFIMWVRVGTIGSIGQGPSITVTANETARYRAIVSGVNPDFSSCTVSTPDIFVTVRPAAVAITQQPPSLIGLCFDEPRDITVAATGAVSYRWKLNNSYISLGDTRFSGITSPTLRINSRVGLPGSTITCGVQGCSAEVDTEPALMQEAQSPVFTLVPQSVIACASQTVMRVAVAADGPVTFRWYRNGDPIPLDDARFIGVQTDTLTILGQGGTAYNSAYQCGVYRCLGAGGIVLSPQAYLSPPTPREGWFIRSGCQAHAHQIRAENLETSDDPLAVYQWRVNGQVLEGQTGPSIEIPDRPFRGTDLIDCTITLCPSDPPIVLPTYALQHAVSAGTVTASSTAVTGYLGAAAELSASGGGLHAGAGAHWHKDGQLLVSGAIAPSGSGRITRSRSGGVETLRITGLLSSDAGSYVLVTQMPGLCYASSVPIALTVATGCGPADVGSQGGIAGHDAQLDNNDFIVFINLFFNGNAAADLGRQGGLAGADGQFDNNDFIAFINHFFTGC